MGAKLSLQHDPDQLASLKQAEETWLKACGGTGLAREEWIDLPSDDKFAGVKQVRTFQLGSKSKDDVPLVLFVHGGGGVALEFADLFASLAATALIKENKLRLWFMERPGHGCSAPFDAFTVQTAVHEHLAHILDALREAAGDVERMHVVGNSAGGWHAYWYAKFYPKRLQSLTFLGCPGLFQHQPLPKFFYVLASWVGTQIMARPPPRSVAEDLIYNFHKQETTDVPDCYVDLYLAFMSLRNSALSWNYMLRCVIWDEKRYFFKLSDMAETLSGGGGGSDDKGIPCHAILGENEIGHLIKPEQLEVLEEQIGRSAVRVEKGGHLPWHGHQKFVTDELVKIWSAY